MTADPSTLGPGPGYKTNWSQWALHAPERACAACGEDFKPSHPRHRYCHGEATADCPGPPRQQRPGARPAADHARTAHLQGLLGEVLLAVHAFDAPTGERKAINDAVRDYVRAEVARDHSKVRAAAVALIAALMVRVMRAQPQV